jgi:hypothetical protein
MNKFFQIVGLKREAVLLDSRLFIVKAMLAISVGFIAGRALPITRLDLVSVLLGVMYNLEAVNVLGLRGGLNQLLASTLGALTTGVLVVLMGYQISFVTVALGIGLTMYIALIIDYRMVSPVAIFTSIYMTQLLQSDAMGQPSVILTFVTRIAALGLGVAIAILFNFLFSVFYYRQLGRRRVEFVKLKVVEGLRATHEALVRQSPLNATNALAGAFNDAEMVKSHLETLGVERRVPINRREKAHLDHYLAIVIELKNMLHLAYDAVYVVDREKRAIQEAELEVLTVLIAALNASDLSAGVHVTEVEWPLGPLSSYDPSSARLYADFRAMATHFDAIVDHVNQLT